MDAYDGMSVLICLLLYTLTVMQVYEQVTRNANVIARDLTPLSATSVFTNNVIFTMLVYGVVGGLSVLVVSALLSGIQTSTVFVDHAVVLPTPVRILFAAVLNAEALTFFSLALALTGLFASVYTLWLRLTNGTIADFRSMIDVMYPYNVAVMFAFFLVKLFYT